MKIILMAIAVFLLSLPTIEASAGDSLTILSLGIEPCGKFVRANPQWQELYFSWAVGFLTGENSMSMGQQRFVGRQWDRDASLIWLQNYCTEHPLEQFVNAAFGLRSALAEQEGIKFK